MKVIPVLDRDGLYRDAETGAIINNNNKDYEQFQKNKIIRQRKLEAEAAKEERINNLEKDVVELKTGISQILDILKNGNT